MYIDQGRLDIGVLEGMSARSMNTFWRISKVRQTPYVKRASVAPKK